MSIHLNYEKLINDSDYYNEVMKSINNKSDGVETVVLDNFPVSKVDVLLASIKTIPKICVFKFDETR